MTDRIVDGDDDGLADGRRRALEEGSSFAADIEVLGDQLADPGEVRPDPEATGLVGRGEQAQGGHVVEDPMRGAARDVGRAREVADAPFAGFGEGLEDADPACHRAARRTARDRRQRRHGADRGRDRRFDGVPGD